MAFLGRRGGDAAGSTCPTAVSHFCPCVLGCCSHSVCASADLCCCIVCACRGDSGSVLCGEVLGCLSALEVSCCHQLLLDLLVLLRCYLLFQLFLCFHLLLLLRPLNDSSHCIEEICCARSWMVIGGRMFRLAATTTHQSVNSS